MASVGNTACTSSATTSGLTRWRRVFIETIPMGFFEPVAKVLLSRPDCQVSDFREHRFQKAQVSRQPLEELTCGQWPETECPLYSPWSDTAGWKSCNRC